MKTSDFDYDLSEELIAQAPIEPRELSRMLVVDRQDVTLTDARSRNIITILKPGDVLVRNVSRVFNARLRGWNKVADARARVGEGDCEMLVTKFLHELPGGDFALPRSAWEVLLNPGIHYSEGDDIYLGYLDVAGYGGDVFATVMRKSDDKVVEVQFNIEKSLVFALCEQFGDVPIPPYVDTVPDNPDDYQNVYADVLGSAAAPTAGFHFSENLLALCDSHGIQFADVVLDVGVGTFRPMKGETLEEHVMHGERVSIDQENIEKILQAHVNGNRVIAIGTTTVRVLEGVYQKMGALVPYEGDIDMFIKPGFEFNVIDGLMTNFHVPKSTLLVLVSAFAGTDLIRKAYKHAVAEKYRFYSFGDAMLIL